jgi:DNA-binding protein HU-beta
MTKAELVAKIAEDTNLTQAQTAKVFNCLIDTIAQEIKSSGNLAIAGLGTFSVVERASRPGINPRTKETITIPAKNTIKFNCAKALKDLVNG